MPYRTAAPKETDTVPERVPVSDWLVLLYLYAAVSVAVGVGLGRPDLSLCSVSSTVVYLGLCGTLKVSTSFPRFCRFLGAALAAPFCWLFRLPVLAYLWFRACPGGHTLGWLVGVLWMCTSFLACCVSSAALLSAYHWGLTEPSWFNYLLWTAFMAVSACMGGRVFMYHCVWSKGDQFDWDAFGKLAVWLFVIGVAVQVVPGRCWNEKTWETVNTPLEDHVETHL